MLVDSMGDGQLKMKSVDGDEASARCTIEQIASKRTRFVDLLEALSDHKLERWLME
jgi:hypothetical protein